MAKARHLQRQRHVDRQLERLFRRYLNRSPKRYYMELRLQKARNLLMQTDMSVINVALACGFASPSHFSKCYRAHYETTPYRERGAHAARLSFRGATPASPSRGSRALVRLSIVRLMIVFLSLVCPLLVFLSSCPSPFCTRTA